MIGIDTASVSRIKNSVQSSAFRDRVFTDNERRYCESKPRPYESYAGIFCAKEAAVKAVGCGFTGGVVPSDIEVEHNEKGAPVLIFHGKAIGIFASYIAYVSISHDGDYAVAVVQLTEKRGEL